MRSGAGYTKSNQSAINSTLGGTPHVVGGDGPPSFPRGRSKEEKDHRREKTKPHHAFSLPNRSAGMSLMLRSLQSLKVSQANFVEPIHQLTGPTSFFNGSLSHRKKPSSGFDSARVLVNLNGCEGLIIHSARRATRQLQRAARCVYHRRFLAKARSNRHREPSTQ